MLTPQSELETAGASVMEGTGLCTMTCRLEASEGMRFLLKSVHYASLSRTDLFTLPCSREVRFSPFQQTITSRCHT